MLGDPLREVRYYAHNALGTTTHTTDPRGRFLAGHGDPLGRIDLKQSYFLEVMPVSPKEPKTQFGFLIHTMERVWEFYGESDASVRSAFFRFIRTC